MPRMNTQILGGFKTGMDRSSRRGGKDGAQRLWLLQNGYINERGEVIPRPGLQHVAGVANSVGLYGWQGQLHVFRGEDDYVDPGNPLVAAHVLRYPIVEQPMTLTGDLPDMQYHDMISYTYATTNAIGTTTFSLVSGALPTGLILNASTGEVSGQATAAGSYSWTVRVVDEDLRQVDLPDTAVVASTDILTYTTVNDGLNQSPSSVAVSDGIIFVGCNNSSATISTDRGSTWTTNDVVGIASPQAISSCIKFNGNWYAFASGSAARCMGDTFNFASITRPTDGVTCAANLGGNLCVGQTVSIGAATVIAKMATDAPTWATVSLGGAYGDVRAMLDVGGAYLFATDDGYILRSTDLATFSVVKSGAVAGLSSIARVGSVVVAGSGSGTWYRSTDGGVTWGVGQTSPAIDALCATPSMFIGARANNIYTSPDAVTWTLRHAATLGSQYGGGAATDGTTACFPRQSNYATVGTN